MEQIARGWLIYQMTDSPLLLGLIQATRALPLLFFGVIAGAVADRNDRKTTLLYAQHANMALNLALATLVLTGHVAVWHVFVTAFLAGISMAFQQPARQSIIPDIVAREHLMNAISLNSAILNMSRSVGPALSGMLIAVFDVGGCYIIQAGLLFVASIWTHQLHLPKKPSRFGRGSIFVSVKEGLQYARTNPVARILLMVALIPIILAQPYNTLFPVFARDIYQIGPAGQGMMLSVVAVGSVAGGFANAAWGDSAPWTKGVQLVGGLMCFGVSLMAFAISPMLLPALVALMFVGVSSTSYRAVNQTLIQSHVEDEYRGRMMSLYLLDRGLAPLGASFAGIVATLFSARIAVGIMGLLTLLLAGWSMIASARVRDMD